ncbi:MAG: response regulator [Desulfobacteraceae bacterium]|nr:MAG: response regulator [Desulfobacteraceae bacterium]
MTRILHIDKDDAIRFLYEEELTEAGYEVVGTSSCEGILDKIAKLNPNIIILEPKFPKVDGLDILQSIRGTHYNMPVIICTAYSAFRYDPRSIAADYFVIKCSDLRDLKLKIKMAIDCRRVFQDESIPKSLPELPGVF